MVLPAECRGLHRFQSSPTYAALSTVRHHSRRQACRNSIQRKAHKDKRIFNAVTRAARPSHLACRSPTLQRHPRSRSARLCPNTVAKGQDAPALESGDAIAVDSSPLGGSSDDDMPAAGSSDSAFMSFGSSTDQDAPAQESGEAFSIGELPQERLEKLQEQFNKFDIDGNGVIDKSELRNLLEAVSSKGNPSTAQGWVMDAVVESVMDSFDQEGNSTMSFEAFTALMQDSILLDGKLAEYQAAFQAVDTSGNGTLGGSEVKALFENLGHPLTDQKLFNVMERFDEAGTGQLGFNDFLDLFRSELLEAQEVLDYIQLRASDAALPERREPSLIEWTPGEVMLIFSGEEFKALSAAHPQRVLVLEASFTWCRPCKGFQPAYEKFAEAYPETIFLKLYGNSNANSKAIFQRLKVPLTPHFTFWREGELLKQHSGASKGKMLAALDSVLQGWDNPIHGASKFKQQVWSARLLGKGA